MTLKSPWRKYSHQLLAFWIPFMSGKKYPSHRYNSKGYLDSLTYRPPCTSNSPALLHTAVAHARLRIFFFFFLIPRSTGSRKPRNFSGRKLLLLVWMLRDGELNRRCLHGFAFDLFAFRATHALQPSSRRVMRCHLSGGGSEYPFFSCRRGSRPLSRELNSTPRDICTAE